MKKICCLMLALCMFFSLAACGKPAEKTEESFCVNIICESKGIYQIFYSCFLNDEYYSMGGMGDYDHNELTEETELKLVFTKDFFEGRDISGFSMSFSPYGKDDTSEIGTTNKVAIAAEYGQSYTIIFSGDSSEGFTAELEK